MLGRQERWQEDLFVAGSLRELIPQDHVLRRVDGILDLTWLREEVAQCYCEDNGRPGIDPEAALRLMLAGFLLRIVHDRRLMREAQVNLAIRWFAGYRLHESLPDHSSLTRIRSRWGEQRFRRIFQRTVRASVEAGLVVGDVLHIDATLVRANVSWDSLVTRHLAEVKEANREQADNANQAKVISRTDPDASLASSSQERGQPSYKQHTSVDDRAGIVVDILVTTGATNESTVLAQQITNVSENTGRQPAVVTADRGYSLGRVYAELERQGIQALIPPKAERAAQSRVPIGRFKYDARHKIVRCPMGKKLRRSARTKKNSWFYRSAVADCRDCTLREQCLSPADPRRSINLGDGYDALLRARRRREHWSANERSLYGRHRWLVEGAHADAKCQHGLARAVRRGLWNMAIQAYLTAAAMNLKRLAALAR